MLCRRLCRGVALYLCLTLSKVAVTAFVAFSPTMLRTACELGGINAGTAPTTTATVGLGSKWASTSWPAGTRRGTETNRSKICSISRSILPNGSGEGEGRSEGPPTGGGKQVPAGLVLREFSMPLQESPGEYARRVQRECEKEGEGAKVVRWHISNADEKRGKATVEVVFLTQGSP